MIMTRTRTIPRVAILNLLIFRVDISVGREDGNSLVTNLKFLGTINATESYLNAIATKERSSLNGPTCPRLLREAEEGR